MTPIITANELEALVLECSQIKQYMPHYNILLKDDKSYPYIKVTVKEPYPRVTLTRRREEDGSLYFGPYSGSVRDVVSTIQKTFLLPSCSRVFPRDIGKGRPCLNAAIKTCMAPCSGKVTQEQYLEAVDEAVAFLEGKQGDLVKELSKRMEQAAEQLRFEEAARLREPSAGRCKSSSRARRWWMRQMCSAMSSACALTTRTPPWWCSPSETGG